MTKYILHLCVYLILLAANIVIAQAPTWSYEADILPSPAPFDEFFGPSMYYSLGSETGVDYLIIDTTGDDGDGDPDNNVAYWRNLSGTKWNVNPIAGYTLEWAVRLDSSFGAEPGAVSLRGADGTSSADLRIYRTGYGPAGATVMQVSGGDGAWDYFGNPYDWHIYRMDVVSGEATVYLDDYPWPILTSTLASYTSTFMTMGDNATGNAVYDVDFLRTYQSGVLAAPVPPDVADNPYTVFLAHYDGDTDNSGLDADYALGSAVVASASGAVYTVSPRFGAGCLDANATAGILSYEVVDNINLEAGTIEMWIKPYDWSNDVFQTFFEIRNEAGESAIMFNKNPDNQLQAWVNGGGISWEVISLLELNLHLDDSWHHIAWTWDKNVYRGHVYVDGVELSGGITRKYNIPIVDPEPLVDTFTVGQKVNGTNPFLGLIDEFRISSVDLYGGRDFTPPTIPYPTPEKCGDANHPYPKADITRDCVVDMADLAVMMDEWMTDLRP